MRTLKKRIILSFTVSFFIFLIFITAIIFSGLNISIKGWFRASESRYSEMVIRELRELMKKEPVPGPSQIRNTVAPIVNNRFSLIIFTDINNILFVYNLPDTSPQNIRYRPEPGSGMGMMMQEHRLRPGAAKMLIQNYPGNIFPVIHEDKTVLYTWIKATAFTPADSINRRFFISVLITLVIGVLASGGVALLSTYYISDKIAREATIVSSGLEKLASGSREVVFPEKGSSEILSISRSADILQQRLRKEEEARKQWTQDIAHDLRTPTSAIKAQLEAIVDGVFKPDKNRLSMLLGELKSLEILIEDINRLTCIESPEAKPDFAEITSEKLKYLLNERFSIAAGEKNISLDFDAESFSIKCDVNLIIRAVSNLVHNSIQYSPEKSVIKVTIKKSTTDAVISVLNPGEIPESEIDKIFNRLYRGEFSRAAKGSGLGLTIAEAAVKLHSGEIKAENIEIDNKSHVKITAVIPQK